jgi:preprotein translocase subunit SecG
VCITTRCTELCIKTQANTFIAICILLILPVFVASGSGKLFQAKAHQNIHSFFNAARGTELCIKTQANAFIAICILLILPVFVASGQGNFSKLKLIKTYTHSSMLQETWAIHLVNRM